MEKCNFYQLQEHETLLEVFTELGRTPKNKINQKNWNTGKVVPSATFCGGYNSKGLYLVFSVKKELEPLRKQSKLNDPVYTDSCVEFFFKSNDDEKSYHNFEFNSNAAMLAQSGTSRSKRTNITLEESKLIQNYCHFASYCRLIDGVSTFHAGWRLEIFFPKSVMEARGIKIKKGTKIKCNFYKCGDNLEEPHYLSWSKVETATPDFHTPEFFGEATLVEGYVAPPKKPRKPRAVKATK